MAVLAVFQRNPISAARVRDALSGDHDLRSYSAWGSLNQALETEGFDGCVLDPFAVSPQIPTSELRRLRKHHPNLVIVVFADFAGRVRQLTSLGGIADEIIVAGVEDTGANIRRVVSDALSQALARRVRSALASRIFGLEADALAWAVENAARHPRVSHLAWALDESQRTLTNRLRSSGGYTVRSLFLWGRLFQAGQRLGSGRVSVHNVARSLGYSADSTFRKTVRKHLGVPPTEIRASGGLNLVVRRFLEVRQSRVMR